MPASSSPDAAQDVLEVERRRYEAMCAGDADALDQLLHERLGYVHSDGTTDGKASYLAGVRSQRWAYQSIRARDQQVRMLGDAALIQGIVAIDVVIEGAPTRFEVVMITALSRDAGLWQVIHSQGTRRAA